MENNLNNLILTPISVHELVDLIATEVEIRVKVPEKQEPLADKIGMEEATKILSLTKSSIYKLTMTNSIPFYKMGKRLFFSRTALLDWMESRTVLNLEPEKTMASQFATKMCKRKLNLH